MTLNYFQTATACPVCTKLSLPRMVYYETGARTWTGFWRWECGHTDDMRYTQRIQRG
jgi:hypothetical protein